MDKKDTGYRGLELLQANAARYYSCVSSSFPGKKVSALVVSFTCISLPFLKHLEPLTFWHRRISRGYRTGRWTECPGCPSFFSWGVAFSLTSCAPSVMLCICRRKQQQQKDGWIVQFQSDVDMIRHLDTSNCLWNSIKQRCPYTHMYVPVPLLWNCCDFYFICIHLSIYFRVGRYISWLCKHTNIQTSTTKHYNLLYENTTNRQRCVNQLMY